ncbi:hypothetical protein RN001_010536 [Aquatica leii]|uniref:EDR1/CTR1/ARMC3-like peptidase-like domain-containing protein n=1 Tax=Aquatica leii TaxID=1421715 RepID=A0AAN7Q3C8_9COLE|nr:hypothetical protein RN001_010536 [Aquatica leii]
MVVKNVEEQQTPFRPVPYETADVRTSITLLTSVEIDVVIRALSTLSKYSDEKDLNVTFLYKSGVVPKLLDLLIYTNLTILRFSLKLLSQIVTFLPNAALELSFEQYTKDLKKITHLFMSSTDNVIKEFCVQFLAHVVKSSVLASSLLKMGIVPTVFDVLSSSQDVDTQYNTLIFFNRVLEAREAITVVPELAEFSPRVLICYIKHQVPEIRLEALNIIEKVASWRSNKTQALLRAVKAIENLFNVLLDEEYAALHKKCLNVILVSMECVETAHYFVESLEFIKFTEWSKTCAKRLMLPSITILVTLFQEPSLKQMLFDFSVEDSILSFFRTENEFIFVKVCEGICSMSMHEYCCEKIVTPVVIKCILQMLRRNQIPVIPYHEIAIKTLLTLLKRNEKTITYIVECSGMEPLKKAALRKKDDYTLEGAYDIIYVLFIYALSSQYKHAIMNNAIYQMLLERFEENSDHSSMAVLILDQYINDAEYREFFIEYNGPFKIITVLKSTPNEEVFKNTLLFMERIFAYKKICMMFLWQGGLKTLEKISQRLKTTIPLIERLTTMIYNLYLPLKFFKLGRLEITDHFDSQFYLVDPMCKDFPFLELLERMNICPRKIIYVVDFSANVSETIKSLQKPELLEKTESTRFSTTGRKSSKTRSKQSVLGKKTSSLKSRESQLERLSVVSEWDADILCRVAPPIKYGYLSDDHYLPQYLVKLQKLIYENQNYIYCFQHQIKAIAKFVFNVLSGTPYPGNRASQNHSMGVHLVALREKLGTTLIPLGYLRYGFHCERSLLFKALSDKLGVPSALVRGRITGKNNLIYWNEVPIVCNEQYQNVEDLKTYMTYAVVDLMNHIGRLMLVGSIEANEYCGLPMDDDGEKVRILTLKNVVDLV